MSEQETPQRPPASGPGSGVTAWREYAATVTGSPLESWSALTREEIVQLLDSEGAGTTPVPSDELTETEQEADRNAAAARAELAEQAPPAQARPEWMVPTKDGWVPEHELIQRTR